MKKLFAFILPLTVALFAFAANEAIKPEGEGTKEAPYLLTSVENLVWMGENIAECQSNVFRLENDIDASETKNWKQENDTWGFMSIGSKFISKDEKEHDFYGVFDGQDFTIKNLYSKTLGGESLFNRITNGTIKNLRLSEVYLGEGKRGFQMYASGALAVAISSSLITNVHVTGQITGYNVGGLAGVAVSNSIVNCSFDGIIEGYRSGGLLGSCSQCLVSLCRTSGSIYNFEYAELAGGLFGEVSYNLGDKETKIINCYSDMYIKSNGYVGGLVGYNDLQNVFCGWELEYDLGFKQCYSNCSIEKQDRAIIGGIAGFTTNSICYNCFYNSEKVKGTAFGEGRSAAALMRRETFKNWNFASVWEISEGQSMPYFASEEGKYFKVSFVVSGYGKLKIEPEKDGYVYGDTVRITAIPDEGSAFMYYSGALSGQETQQTLMIEENAVIKAAFAKEISSLDDFYKLGSDYYSSADHYVQTVDFDLEGTTFTNQIDFCYGVYDGNNHAFKNFKTESLFKGFFNSIRNATVCNLNIINLEVGYFDVSGALAKTVDNSVISNCYICAKYEKGQLASSGGAICGRASKSLITRCNLIFEILGKNSSFNFSGLCYAANSVVDQCGIEIQSENVKARLFEGESSKILNCFVSGKFSGTFLPGSSRLSCFASNCYLNAEGTFQLGPNANYANCYFNSNLIARVEGVEGFVSDEDMKKQATYAGWDFENIWGIEEGVGTPYFQYALPEPIGFLALLGLALLGMKRRLG